MKTELLDGKTLEALVGMVMAVDECFDVGMEPEDILGNVLSIFVERGFSEFEII